MRLRLRLACVFLLLCSFVASALAEDQRIIEERLNSKLHNALLVLRNPYNGQKLRFDADGATKNELGIRGFDDKLQVTNVQLVKGQLVIKGTRLNDQFDPNDNGVKITSAQEPVEVRIAVPDDSDEEVIAASYHKVFLRTSEIAERSCRDYSYLAKLLSMKAKAPTKGPKSAAQEDHSVEVCVPSGLYAWTSDTEIKGLVPAKVIKQSEPSYPDLSIAARQQGYVEVALRIGVDGRISDGILLVGKARFTRSVTSVLSEWVFKPAEIDGKPVPSITVLDVAFRGTFH